MSALNQWKSLVFAVKWCNCGGNRCISIDSNRRRFWRLGATFSSCAQKRADNVDCAGGGAAATSEESVGLENMDDETPLPATALPKPFVLGGTAVDNRRSGIFAKETAIANAIAQYRERLPHPNQDALVEISVSGSMAFIRGDRTLTLKSGGGTKVSECKAFCRSGKAWTFVGDLVTASGSTAVKVVSGMYVNGKNEVTIVLHNDKLARTTPQPSKVYPFIF